MCLLVVDLSDGVLQLSQRSSQQRKVMEPTQQISHPDPVSSSSTDIPSISSNSNAHRSANGNARSIISNNPPPNAGNAYTLYLFLNSIMLIFTLTQIIASIVMLVLSTTRHQKPPAILFSWVVVYALLCTAYLPILFSRYLLAYPRIYALVDGLRVVYEVGFAIWFGVGNYWILGGHSSSKAPSLYRLALVFLIYGYIKYATPFLTCSLVLCFRHRLHTTRAAPAECINALPTYTFKLLKNSSGNARNVDIKLGEDGVVAAGTERERVIPGDDAVCSICLAKYEDGEDLKELPCLHLYHSACIDKWLEVRAVCPVCKHMVRLNHRDSSSSTETA